MESEAKTIRIPEPRSDARTLTTDWTTEPESEEKHQADLKAEARRRQALDRLTVHVFGDDRSDPTAAPSPRPAPKRGKRGFLEPWRHQVHRAALKATDNRHFCKLLDIDQVRIPLNWLPCRTWTDAYDSGKHRAAIRRYKQRYRVA